MGWVFYSFVLAMFWVSAHMDHINDTHSTFDWVVDSQLDTTLYIYRVRKSCLARKLFYTYKFLKLFESVQIR